MQYTVILALISFLFIQSVELFYMIDRKVKAFFCAL